MASRTLIKFGYDSQALIDTDDLPTLLRILEGEAQPEEAYIYNEDGNLTKVHYLKDAPFSVNYGPAPRVTYLTEEQYNNLREEEAARREARKPEEAYNG